MGQGDRRPESGFRVESDTGLPLTQQTRGSVAASFLCNRHADRPGWTSLQSIREIWLLLHGALPLREPLGERNRRQKCHIVSPVYGRPQTRLNVSLSSPYELGNYLSFDLFHLIVVYRAIKTKRKIIELRSVSQKKHNESLFDTTTVNAAGDVKACFPRKERC
ncbi:hypothetical protein D3C75_796980 [compost metagenome]